MYHALIQTHHIISRRKISVIKAAAKKHGLRALIRSGGGVPGVMYVRNTRDGKGQDGDEEGEKGVRDLVEVVRCLHYKDYRLVAAPARIHPSSIPNKPPLDASVSPAKKYSDEVSWSFEEVGTVKEFGKRMDEMGVLEWWRQAMAFKN